MKHLSLICVLTAVLLLPRGWGGTIEAQGWPCPGVKPGGQIGFQQLTVSAVAVSLTLAGGFTPVVVAIVNVESNPVRFRVDGTAPTTTVGEILNDTDRLILCGASIGRIQFIRDGASDATLNVHFYGGR